MAMKTNRWLLPGVGLVLCVLAGRAVAAKQSKAAIFVDGGKAAGVVQSGGQWNAGLGYLETRKKIR